MGAWCGSVPLLITEIDNLMQFSYRHDKTRTEIMCVAVTVFCEIYKMNTNKIPC